MPDTEIPVRFELIKNGKRQAIGGVEFGVTNLHVTREARDPHNIPAHRLADEQFDRERYLKVHFTTSLTSYPDNLDETHHWVESQTLDVGDEITLRILGPGQVDEPARRESQFVDSAESEVTDYDIECHEADLAYEAALDGIFSGITLSHDEFRKVVDKMFVALNHYKQVLQKAIKGSKGEDKDAYQYMYNSLSRFPIQLLESLIGYRHRLGLEPAAKEE